MQIQARRWLESRYGSSACLLECCVGGLRARAISNPPGIGVPPGEEAGAVSDGYYLEQLA
jgi:hypothetical protein